MPRDNRYMYIVHVCFYVCCSDCVGVCGNACCVAAVVKNSGFWGLGVLKYVVCLFNYLLPNLYLSVTDIENPDLFACSSWTWISLNIARIYEEHCQPSSGSAWPACPKNGNRAPIAGGGRVDTICTGFAIALHRV